METRAAWRLCAFGKLLASAEIRKIVLKFIVPQLDIDNKVSFEGDYLKVHHYKIHIGSGHVLRGPDNEFVRLDAGGKVGYLNQLFLPLEGDRILNVIIEKFSS